MSEKINSVTYFNEEEDCQEPNRCELCNWPWVEQRRIELGKWGGTYEKGNVLLCPNHHKAIHFPIDWLYLPKPRTRP